MRPESEIPSVPPSASSPYWIDLQPGWRVRVVTPVTKSGSYLVKTQPIETRETRREQVIGSASPNIIALSAGPDFIGYETSIYAVKHVRGNGVRVIFKSAEIHEKGLVIHSRHPIEPLFQIPRIDEWVRILHLNSRRPRQS